MKQPLVLSFKSFSWSLLPAAAIALAVTGCNAILGIEPGEKPEGAASSGSGSGTGGEGGVSCTPRSTRPCYSGPEGTEGIGACAGGTQTCLESGDDYSACEGELLPAEELPAAGDENCNGYESAEVHWTKSFGDSPDQYVSGVAADAEGNIIAVGSFQGSVYFGGQTLTSAGNQDIFVVKFAPSGEHLWSVSFGSANDQSATSVAVDSLGNIFITGYFIGSLSLDKELKSSGASKDVFVAKLDSQGVPKWSKAFGDASNQTGQSVAVDKDGNVIIAGDFMGSVNFGAGAMQSTGDYDVFVAMLDANGNRMWEEGLGGTTTQRSKAVAVDGDRNVLVTGSFSASMQVGGETLQGTENDMYLVKFTPSGEVTWSRQFGGPSSQFGTKLAVDPKDGSIAVGGFFLDSISLGGETLMTAGAGLSSIFIGKLNADGGHVWSKAFGDGTATVNGLTVDVFGNVLATGDFQASINLGGSALQSSGDSDVFLAKLGADGKHVWSKSFGDANGQFGTAIAVDPFGGVLATAHMAGTFDLGGEPITCETGCDILLKVEP